MKIRYPYVLAPLLLMVTMGSTDCESFDTVTVPAADTSPPITMDGVWWDGEYKILKSSSNADAIVYHLGNDESVLAISSAMDSGGLKRLTMNWDKSWTCCNTGAINCTNYFAANYPPGYSEWQTAVPGQSVSNGIWYGVEAKKPSAAYPDCPGGKYPTKYQFRWWTRGENFHGGTTIGKTHKILWP